MATRYYVRTSDGVFLGGWDDGNPSAPTGETEVASPPPVNRTQIWQFPGWSALTPPDNVDEYNTQLALDLNLSGTNTGDQNLFETFTADSGSTTADILTDTLNVVGGTNVTTAISGDTLTITASGGAGGETNTASNQGGFDEWFIQKTGVDLEFRTVQSSDGSLTITQNADNLDITSTQGEGITEIYISPLQTIVPAGTLVLAHGLTVEPYITLMVLENVTPEHGFSAGERTPANAAAGASSNNQGAAIVPDATNLNIKFGTGSGGGTPVFSVIDRTTGTSENITNANWNVIFLALA